MPEPKQGTLNQEKASVGEKFWICIIITLSTLTLRLDDPPHLDSRLAGLVTITQTGSALLHAMVAANMLLLELNLELLELITVYS
jgi:hypothetical protein